MKRTLLVDILQVYRSLKCITKEDESEFCYNCNKCKNYYMCTIIGDLINSMSEFY